ncbi:unnamed protein product [Rotaria sp. Silwood1]|nr:unnamed protein product [Rotaria sp. Silwood1]CAF4995729.1 unnamed protein product [Rotaria sp. Silwood1]
MLVNDQLFIIGHGNVFDGNEFVHQQSSQQARDNTASHTQMSQPQNIPRPTKESVSPNHQSYQDTKESTQDSESLFHQQLPQSTPTPRSTSQEPQAIDENAALYAEICKYREQNAELIQRFQQLNEELKRKKIDSFEALTEQDKEMKKILIELANITQPMPMEGNNIGLFGLTSTGKSTILNAILGQKLAKTGVGETTKKIVSYSSTHFTLWDVPGRNDEINYMNMEYISFFKGLSKRLLLIEATVKENSSMMKLLDAIGLHYAIVFNKFDKVDDDEQQAIQQQIKQEIRTLGLKGVDQVFFVSGKFPKKFSDWQAMLNYMQNLSC